MNGIIIFIIIIAVVIIVMGKAKGSKEKNNSIGSKKKVSVENGYLSKSVMTKTELHVFNEIQKDLNSRYHLLAQVRLADIVKVNTDIYKARSSEWQSLFNKISRWHCDFVIMEIKTGKVLCAIELDDHTHRADKRINRDIDFNDILKSAKIPLFRVDKDNFKNILPIEMLS